jgi:DNA-binding MarR family transcriptional regulator
MRIIGLEIVFRVSWIKRHHAHLVTQLNGAMPHDDDLVRLSNEGMRQADIAKRVGLNQGSVSRRLRTIKKRKTP